MAPPVPMLDVQDLAVAAGGRVVQRGLSFEVRRGEVFMIVGTSGCGMKTGLYPEDIAVAWAALQLRLPVKWQAERLEDFLSAVHGRCSSAPGSRPASTTSRPSTCA